MHEIYGFLQLASRLANPFGHPLQVRMQVLLLQTCIDLQICLARALRLHNIIEHRLDLAKQPNKTCLNFCIFFAFLCRITMDEAKEVHSSLRTAAGIFKFVKVQYVLGFCLRLFQVSLLQYMCLTLHVV